MTVPAVVLAPPKVLLLRLGGVGDVLLLTPLIRAIRALAARPDAGARDATGQAAPPPPAPPDQQASGWSLF